MSIQPDGRYVDQDPFEPDADLGALARGDLNAPAWVLIWREFRRHRLALVSGIFLLLCYLMLPFAGFIAPYGANQRLSEHLYAPPQSVNLWHEGRFIGPYVHPMTSEPNLQTFQWEFKEDTSRAMPLLGSEVTR